MTESEISRSFGRKLRKARQARGFTVRELARVASIHPTYISKLELFQVEPPEWDKIVALANALESEPLMKEAYDALVDQLMQTYKYACGRGDTGLIRLEMMRIARELIKVLRSFPPEGGGSQLAYVSSK